MIHGRTRPLDPFLVNSIVGDPRIGRRYTGDLLHDLRGMSIGPMVSQPIHQFHKYDPVGLGLSNRLNRPSYPLNPSFSIGKGSILLSKGGSRKYQIGKLCRFSEEYILNHQEVRLLQSFLNMFCVRIGYHWVLTHDIQEFNPSVFGSLEHLRNGQARFGGEFNPPSLFKLFDDFRIVYLLIAWKVSGQCPHVTGTLDIILPPQGVDPYPFLA